MTSAHLVSLSQSSPHLHSLVAAGLHDLRDWVVAEMFQNCGHIHVLDCESWNISNTGLEDHSVEICILCLAMWGSNCHDYVREAHRILESGGKLYIMEATKRWTDEGDEAGKRLKNLLEVTGFQITKQSIEKFCLFVCSKM